MATQAKQADGVPVGRNGAYRLYDHTPPEWAARGGHHLEVRPGGLDVGAHAVFGPGYRAWRVILPDGTTQGLRPNTSRDAVVAYLRKALKEAVVRLIGRDSSPLPGRIGPAIALALAAE